jgi:hypothetical protein
MATQDLAAKLTLGGVLDEVRRRGGKYQLLAHWKQGEFHHDTVIEVNAQRVGVPGPVLVIATNCNGGVKEVLSFGELPDRYALWHHRCPQAPEFSGVLPPVLESARTLHWFDPCNLLMDDARSEYRAEFRERQLGGGWQMKACGSLSCVANDADPKEPA